MKSTANFCHTAIALIATLGISSHTHAQVAPDAAPAIVAPANDPNIRKPIAVVNGAVITGTDLDQRVSLLVATSQGKLSDEELQQVRAQVLRNIIDETLQIQAAEAQKLEVTPAEVDSRFAEVAARNFGEGPNGIAKMNAQLASLGSSPDSLKRQIKGEIAWQMLLGRNITPFINVSTEEASEHLKALEDTKGTDEYRIGEIFMRSTPETSAAVYANAQGIMEQLKQGGSFVAYARQFSEASTATVGGDLGFVQLNRLPVEMAAEVRQMQVGQLIGPIAIPGGFSIVALIDKKQVAMADPRDSVLSLKQISMKQVKGLSAKQFEVETAKFGKAMDQIKSCDMAESISASIGAEVVPNDAVDARSLPPQLQAALLQMQVGDKTPPFGSVEDGVRILMLCGRQQSEEAAKKSVEQIRQQLENERVDKRAQAYLRDLRNDADIQYN